MSTTDFRGLVLFSSHSWRHHDDRTRLHERLETYWDKGSDFIDLSSPAAHPITTAESVKELGEALRARIELCDAVVVFTGMYADSFWINFEVNAAFALRKPIIPVAPWGQQRHSSVATNFASCEVVRWNASALCNAILQNISFEAYNRFAEMRERRREAFAKELAMRREAQRLQFLFRQSSNALKASALAGGSDPGVVYSHDLPVIFGGKG